MNTIPASQLVNVLPGVLQAGGAALDLNGLFLTNSTRVPIGTVAQFPDEVAVESYFGPGEETDLAIIYFNGFLNATAAPGNLLFAQYNQSAVAAFVRGGNVSSLSLTQLQGLTGSVDVTVDGYARTAASINLSGATSFSNAASLIETALNTGLGTLGTFTGIIAVTTGILTVSGGVTGTPIAVGQTLNGAGMPANTIVTAFISGTGGNGTYQTNTTTAVSSETMTTTPTPVVVTYDSQSGAFIIESGITGVASTMAFPTGSLSSSLLLTSTGGAVLSQGAAAQVPATFMSGIIAVTQNWATFMHTFEVDQEGENSVKFAFAQWVSGQNDRYAYVCSDSDQSPTTEVPATSSLGYLISQAGLSGIFLISEAGHEKAAFTCGIAASINFEETNGRTTFAYRSQAGLVPDVTSASVATNLTSNGYNFYGAYATANQQFMFLQDGQVSGSFNWMDSYINQIQLNNAFQLSLVELLATVKSIPYTIAGNTMIENTLSPDIQAALNFGTIRAGVTPSATEALAANAAAGATIDGVLATQGWYLQVLTPSATVRQQRGTPVCNFWYMDGQSIQKITLSSINVQ